MKEKLFIATNLGAFKLTRLNLCQGVFRGWRR
jgi:hypothetical protein